MSESRQVKQALMQALNRHLERGEPADLSPELSGWVETAEQLRAQAELYQPKADFLARTRTRLLVHARRPTTPWNKNWRQQPLTLRMVVSLALALVVVFSGSSMLLAAQAALPGQVLYPLRTLSENTRLGLSFDPEQDVALHLEYAQNYLVDCAMLIAQNHHEQAQIALRNYDRHLADASRILSSTAASNWQTRALQATLTQDAAIIDLLLAY